jgi:hypothetical protein
MPHQLSISASVGGGLDGLVGGGGAVEDEDDALAALLATDDPMDGVMDGVGGGPGASLAPAASLLVSPTRDAVVPAAGKGFADPVVSLPEAVPTAACGGSGGVGPAGAAGPRAAA